MVYLLTDTGCIFPTYMYVGNLMDFIAVSLQFQRAQGFIEVNIPTSPEASPELRGVVDRGPRLTGDVWLGSRE